MNAAIVAPSLDAARLLAAGGLHHRRGGSFIFIILLIIIVVAVILIRQRRHDRPLPDNTPPPPLDDHVSPRVTPKEPEAARVASAPMNTEPRGTTIVTPRTKTAKQMPPGRYGLGGLLRSEWTKLRTVRSTMWTLSVTVVLGVGLSALVTAETRAHWSTMSLGSRLTFDPTSASLVGIFVGQFAIGVLGAMVVTAEYGTGTIRATFAGAPRRPLVLVAKAIVFGAVAFVVAEVVSFLSFFLGQALLTAPATHATLSTPGALREVFGSALYVCILGLFALGLATIIRHTAGAISAFVGILLVLPLILQALPTSIADDLRRFLPDRIGATMLSLHPGPHTFSPWIGLIVLFIYAIVALFIGGVLLVRRDA